MLDQTVCRECKLVSQCAGLDSELSVMSDQQVLFEHCHCYSVVAL